MSLVLFGPPGAGKGTQSQAMIEQTDMIHISTGDLFRTAIKEQTPLGVEAKNYVDNGKLVPDTVVIGLVIEFMNSNMGKSFIFDGFPRTIAQAEALDDQIKDLGASQIDSALFLEVPEDVLLSRLSGRRICRSCSAVYHVKNSAPSKEGVCDKCGGEVYQRTDDKEDAVQTRLDAYQESTSPLKEFYHEKGILTEIRGTGTTSEVFERIKPFLKN